MIEPTRDTMVRSPMRQNRSVLVTFLAALVALAGTVVDAQVGVDICACQPSTYEFTLDFASTLPANCDLGEIIGPGLNETTCRITRLNDPNDAGDPDLMPVSVTDIQVLELDQNLLPLVQTPIVGDFRSGDTFRYTSIIANGLGPDPMAVPRGFLMTINGRNSLDEDLQQRWVILYDNDCGIFPILFEGTQLGWTVFSDLGAPPIEVCPLAPAPVTDAPSVAPIMAPPLTPTPTVIAAEVSESPSLSPLTPGTEAPVSAPLTNAPVTRAPVNPPATGAPATSSPVTRAPVSPNPKSSLPSKGGSKGSYGMPESSKGSYGMPESSKGSYGMPESSKGATAGSASSTSQKSQSDEQRNNKRGGIRRF
jgi:hypothetical protein